jgi:hypothetical protein
MTNPQSWNRYAHVMNNPLSFTDPLGLEVEGGGSDTSGGEDVGGPGGPADRNCSIGFDGAGSPQETCGDFTFFLPTIPRITGISGPVGPSQPPGGGTSQCFWGACAVTGSTPGCDFGVCNPIAVGFDLPPAFVHVRIRQLSAASIPSTGLGFAVDAIQEGYQWYQDRW